MPEITTSDLMKELGKIEGMLSSAHKRLDKVEKDVSDVKAIANMGKGGMYVFLKVGGVLAFFAMLGTAVWQVAK